MLDSGASEGVVDSADFNGDEDVFESTNDGDERVVDSEDLGRDEVVLELHESTKDGDEGVIGSGEFDVDKDILELLESANDGDGDENELLESEVFRLLDFGCLVDFRLLLVDLRFCSSSRFCRLFVA